MFTYIHSLLIEKDGCDRRNISIKFPCVCVCLSYRNLQFLVRVFPFLSLILCYLYVSTFLSTWSIYIYIIRLYQMELFMEIIFVDVYLLMLSFEHFYNFCYFFQFLVEEVNRIDHYDKKCIKKKERVRHLPGYCP